MVVLCYIASYFIGVLVVKLEERFKLFKLAALLELIMTVPIEALAMAGIDYNEWGLDIEKWEDDDSEWPPPHLLAEQEEEEEPERDVKQGIQNIGTSLLTHPSEDLDGNCDDKASSGATGECRRHRRMSQGRTLVKRIIQSLRSIKLMVTYMERLLIIAMIVGRNRSLKSS